MTTIMQKGWQVLQVVGGGLNDRLGCGRSVRYDKYHKNSEYIQSAKLNVGP